MISTYIEGILGPFYMNIALKCNCFEVKLSKNPCTKQGTQWLPVNIDET